MAVSATTLRLADSSAARARARTAKLDRELTARYAAEWSRRSDRVAEELRRLSRASKSGWPTRAELQRSKALNRELRTLENALARLAEQAVALVEAALAEALNTAADEQREVIASQLPPAWRSTLAEADAERRRKRIKAAANRARTLLERIPRQVAAGLRRAARQPVPTTTPAAMVRAVVEKVRAAFLTGLSRTLTVAGTEVMDAHRAGAVIGQQEHDDVVTGWIWTARLDRSTCPACLSMHGSLHKVSEPGPLGHPRCRCIRVPKTKSWKELGFDLGLEDPPEPEDMVRDAQKWFWGLPKKEQLQIMGPSRLALLKDGEITWSDLAVRRKNPGWRDSYAVRNVRDLRK